MRGSPVGTIALYDYDNRRASKVAVVHQRGTGPSEIAPVVFGHRRCADGRDDSCRDRRVSAAAAVRSLAMVDGIIGRPHEEIRREALDALCRRTFCHPAYWPIAVEAGVPALVEALNASSKLPEIECE